MCRSRALIGLNNQNDYRSENATHKNPQPNVVYIFCNSFFVVVFTFVNSGLCSFYRLLVIHILLILFASCKNGQKCVTAYSWPCSFCPTLLNQSSIYLYLFVYKTLFIMTSFFKEQPWHTIWRDRCLSMSLAIP